MIQEYLIQGLHILDQHERRASVSVVGLFALVVVGLLIPAVRYAWPSRTRMLLDVYVAGLDGGKRSLQQAREHFTFNCAAMLLEGYEKALYRAHSAFRMMLIDQQTKGGFYYIPSPAGERLMIPTRYIEELKNAPDESVDFTGSFLEVGRLMHV
ncbi:MAG: hypothetical protein Q9226_005873 [Calogaya cf. arnoldii]